MAENVRGIEMGQLDDTARRLLREMGYLAEGNLTLGRSTEGGSGETRPRPLIARVLGGTEPSGGIG
jgi:hypothetical protein